MKKEKSRFKTILQVAFTLAVVFFLVKYVSQDWSHFRESIRSASPGWLGVAFLMVFAATLNNAVAWKYLLGILGGRISVIGAVRAYYFSVMAKYIPGKIWGFTARILFSKMEGVPEGTGTMTILLETAFLTITAAALSGLSAAQWPAELPAGLRALVMLLPLSIIFLHPRLLRLFMGILAKRFPKYITIPEEYIRFRNILHMAWIYGAIWVWYGSGFYFVLKSLHLVTIDDFVPLVSAGALAWVVGNLVTFSPAGLGVREFVLVAMTGEKVGAVSAAMAAVCVRIFIVLGEGLGALILKLAARRRNNA